MATASWDHTARLHDLDTGRTLKLTGAHQKGLYAVRFSGVETQLCGTVSSDHTCCLWDIDRCAECHVTATSPPLHRHVTATSLIPTCCLYRQH